MANDKIIGTLPNNKILAMVKFNDREAFVLERPLQLKYTRYGNGTLVGIDGCFLSCYYYEKPWGRFKAFAGREFDLKMTDGTVQHCNGQWWDGISEKARQAVSGDIIDTTASDIESLGRCYCFSGFTAIKHLLDTFRATYKGKTYDYWEYEAKLKQEKP